MSKNLSIIIVNWNGINFLPNCLKSIIDNPPSIPFEIVVVDNDSSDKSVEWLKSKEVRKMFEKISFRLIESQENLGFGKANNLAIEKTDSPIIFLLNPDTIVKPNAIDNLIKTLKSDQKIGMVAPNLLNEDLSLQKNSWELPTAFRIIFDGLKLDKLVPLKYRKKWSSVTPSDLTKKQDVPLVSGAAMMVKRDLINKVGAFDSDIFMYGEDIEWCIRIGRNGWRIVLDPSAKIIHLGGQSSVQMWGEKDTRIKEEKAFLQFQLKCFSPSTVLKNVSARIFLLTIFYLLSLFKFKPNDQIRKILCMQIYSFKDILKNK